MSYDEVLKKRGRKRANGLKIKKKKLTYVEQIMRKVCLENVVLTVYFESNMCKVEHPHELLLVKDGRGEILVGQILVRNTKDKMFRAIFTHVLLGFKRHIKEYVK